MQAGSAMHVTRSTRFLPLEISAVLPRVCLIVTFFPLKMPHVALSLTLH